MAARGARGGPRCGAPSMRLRGTRSAGRGRGSGRGGGVQKIQAMRVRQLQPRAAAALQANIERIPRIIQSGAMTRPQTGTNTGPTVTRIHDLKFMCSTASLFFAPLCGLHIIPDTETIALNLMDYFLQLPAHSYPRELWYGHLHAVCLLLASELAGCENEIDDVCRAVEMQAAGLVGVGAADESLRVHAGQVLEGLRMVVGLGEEIKGCVGGYWYVLEGLFAKTAGGEVESGQVGYQDRVEYEVAKLVDDGKKLYDLDTFDEV